MMKRSLPLLLLVAYILILFKVMVLKDMPNIRIGHLMLNFGGTQTGESNFVPFRTIARYGSGGGGLLIAGINLAGNIALLMPLGFLLPFAFARMNWMKALAWAIGSGLAIEALQLWLKLGIFDIDDVLLNGIGVMLGYWLQALFVKWFRTPLSRSLAILSIGVIMIAGVFLVARLIQGGRNPIRPREDVRFPLPDSSGAKASGDRVFKDPCSGTGGTGRILTVGSRQITIRRRDGLEQVIHLTDETKIRSGSGVATSADLKAGQGVTIVTTDDSRDDRMTAVAVLICDR